MLEKLQLQVKRRREERWATAPSSEGQSRINAVVSSRLRLMREILARQHWNFATAPVLRGPDHRSMGGLALTFPSHNSCVAPCLSRSMAILALRPKRRLSPLPKAYAEICVASSDHELMVGQT